MMTPARRKRDLAKSDAEQRRIDEEKYVGFSVACNNDEANACHSLGEWYAVLRANFSKAAELYRPNCLERGYANSCFNLGLLFGAGKGVQKDRTAALELFERGFEMTACRNLMLMHVRGDGVPKDFAKAEEFRQRSVAAVEQESGVRMPEYLQERFRKNHGPEARS
ncbi:hypothetical protein FNF29_04240 [Cafeteria roenbergensis]|uniref:Sel1 repeat family protein n=1 Tax=Cafeteria roenbergensis TaxID=33653 RepID=A0A5A8CH74_CAFRO|nr:hypothetical protein FNF29_04240 [Cafeteria roenbergensis]|eukprot:KAA0151834.1 hypothetical protein FNF29_04240 [Cafeteria roenbergensis]